jgi:DNA-binding response OmpR family regulator
VRRDAEGAWALCRALRKRDTPVSPLLVLVRRVAARDLELRNDLFDDFCLTPFHPVEVDARLKHLFWRGGEGLRPDMVEYSGLALNLETYQASIGSRPLDLTYMEYELLKFLAQNPGKVFTREMLLSRVWGYEYYGGARTVDVHIRRLRAKLGEEHANLIQTVRSVGYRSGSRAGASERAARGADRRSGVLSPVEHVVDADRDHGGEDLAPALVRVEPVAAQDRLTGR